MIIDFCDVLGELVQKRLGNGGNLDAVFPGYRANDRGITGQWGKKEAKPKSEVGIGERRVSLVLNHNL